MNTERRYACVAGIFRAPCCCDYEGYPVCGCGYRLDDVTNDCPTCYADSVVQAGNDN